MIHLVIADVVRTSIVACLEDGSLDREPDIQSGCMSHLAHIRKILPVL